MELPLFLKTVIISSPQDFATPAWAEEMRKKLDCTSVIEAWYPLMPISPGALHLTNTSPQALAQAGHTPDTVVLVPLGW